MRPVDLFDSTLIIPGSCPWKVKIWLSFPPVSHDSSLDSLGELRAED